MLVPAGVFVLLTLGAIAVDSSLMFMAKREMLNTAVAAANDASTTAIDSDELSVKGVDAEIDEQRATDLAKDYFARDSSSELTVDLGSVDATLDDSGDHLTVVAKGRVRLLFAPALPGQPSERQIDVSAGADLHRR